MGRLGTHRVEAGAALFATGKVCFLTGKTSTLGLPRPVWYEPTPTGTEIIFWKKIDQKG